MCPWLLLAVLCVAGGIEHAVAVGTAGAKPINLGAELQPALLYKRGTGWGLNATQIDTLEGLGWWYNWGSSVGDAAASKEAAAVGMMFAPMQWGRWGVEDLAAHVAPGSTVLLGFNEPNHRKQANLTPQQAAALWPQLEDAADKLGLRLGAPAAAPCGAECVTPNPFTWWDEFFAHCSGCRVDFLATHLYSCNPDVLAAYLKQCRKYQLPIWLTEFSCPNPGGADVVSMRFMVRALEQLDQDDWVQRYAWYALSTDGWLGTSNSLMDMDSGKLTDLGRLYLGHPSAQPAAAAESSILQPEAQESLLWSGEDAWSTRCGPCLRHVEGGRALAELTARQRCDCSQSCGLWDEDTAEATGRLCEA